MKVLTVLFPDIVLRMLQLYRVLLLSQFTGVGVGCRWGLGVGGGWV